jgi:hypothetical protein
LTRPLLARGVWDRVARAFANDDGLALVAFDLDGTLAPIVDDPARARIPATTKRLLAALAADRGLVVAIVSARRSGLEAPPPRARDPADRPVRPRGRAHLRPRREARWRRLARSVASSSRSRP